MYEKRSTVAASFEIGEDVDKVLVHHVRVRSGQDEVALEAELLREANHEYCSDSVCDLGNDRKRLLRARERSAFISFVRSVCKLIEFGIFR